MKCTFIVYRFEPAVDKEPRYQEYMVEAEPTDKILDCLNKIRWEQDPTLSYRSSCAHGICGSDALMINGRIELACQRLVRDFKTANNFVIEPLPLFKVIKDLIVDMDPFFEKHRTVRPYLINDEDPPEKERLQDPENQKFFEHALACILCGSCTAACPINRSNDKYLGPAALLRGFRYVADSRDTATGSRLAQLDNENGAWGCKSMWWCTDVCPKSIPVTKSIAQIKRLIKEEGKSKTAGS
ncbi:MAG: succinate dehydrogenase iron-sulfur subunit [Deltaproteobacteria bacterium]|nr:succinate dehydrogenase iron-sulfur subunit [Deltaproteobacteria bacterium]